MTQFLLENGRSQTPGWEEHLRTNSPVYHVDLAVSSGSKTSTFAVSSLALERVRTKIRFLCMNKCVLALR